MRKRLICLLALFVICLTVINAGIDAVRAESGSKAGSTEGIAYAILTDAGDLVFFRSSGTYTSGSGKTVTDIMGNTYTGTLYGSIESKTSQFLSASDRQKVKKAYVASGQTIKPISMSEWFLTCASLTSFDGTGFDTGNVTSMSEMFSGCSSLTSLDLSGFDTGRVTNMRGMFNSCSILTGLNISGFDTSKVTDMGSMFAGCSNLTSLDISGFNTGNVTDMGLMFYGCSSLTGLDVSRFDTGKVTIMQYMFYNCGNLSDLNVSGFDTAKVTDMSSMFCGCSKLSSLDVSGFDMSSVKYMNHIFYDCGNLHQITLGAGVTRLNSDCGLSDGRQEMWTNDLLGLNLSASELISQYPSNASDWAGTWRNTGLAYAVLAENGDLVFFRSYESYASGAGMTVTDIEGNTYTGKLYRNIENTQIGFLGDDDSSEVKKAYIAHGQTIRPKNTKNWFSGCNNLTSIDLSGLDTDAVTDMSFMFSGCSGLTSLDVTGFDTSNVTNMSGMFYNCSNLTGINVSSFDTGKVTDMSSMFISCSNLTGINVSSFNTETVTNMSSMFRYCRSLTSINVSNFDTGNVTNMNSMFSDCSSLKSINVSSFATGRVTNMSCMFYNCGNLTRIDLSGFDTSSVTNMSSMFNGCTKLTSLDISRFNTGKVSNMTSLFYNCNNLKEVVLGEGFTRWYVTLPAGTWVNTGNFLKKTEQEIYQYYGQNASEWKGTWVLETEVESGTCGDGMTWRLMSSGILYIEGTGRMKDYATWDYYGSNNNASPWRYDDRVKCIDIGENVTYIGSYAFESCKATTILFHNGLEIGMGAFREAGILSIDFASFDMKVGQYAFCYSSLTQVDLGTGNVFLDYCAFNSCKSLDSIVIPSGVTLGRDVFQFAGLKSATIGISGPLPDYTFEVCTSLTTVSITGEVTTIGDGCFRAAPLNSLTLPASVTQISSTALARTGNGNVYPSVPLVRVENPELDLSVLTAGIGPTTTVLEASACSRTAAFAQAKGYTFNAIDDSEHTPNTEIQPVTATCTTEGNTARIVCESCGYIIQESETVLALGHEMELIPARTPKCEEDGCISHYACSRCEKLFLDEAGQTELDPEDVFEPATGHAWDAGTVTKEVTCTEDGTVTYRCLNDSSHVRTETVPARGHVAGEPVQENHVQADCDTPEHYDEVVRCSVCGEELSRETKTVGTSLGHDLVLVASSAATCEEDGHARHYKCSRCGRLFLDSNGRTEIEASAVIIPALGHDLVHFDAKEATCTESGWEAYDSCSRCDYTTIIEIPALGHDYHAVVTAPTCTESGYTTHTCSRCGESYSDTYTPAIGHDYRAVEGTSAAATCTEKGKEADQKCSRCGSVIEGADIAALGHDLVSHAAKAASCTDIGWEAYDTCSRCSYTTYKEIAALGHDYHAVVTAPTCTESGYTTHTCSRCNDSYVDDPVAALGHKWGEWTTVLPATEDTEGLERRVCLNDTSHVEERPIPVLGHTHKMVYHEPVAAACETEGSTEYWQCSGCGKLFSDAAGSNEIQSENTVIKALGHSYLDTVTAPTCTEVGYTTHICSRCGNSITDTYTSALGHDLGEWTITKEATCTEKGEEARTCSRCDEKETRELAALGHALEHHEAQAATCTAVGWKAYDTCARCDYTTYVEIPAIGHDWSEPSYTWSEDNSSVTAKVVCSNDPKHVIEETAETTSKVIKEPTVTEEGEMLYTADFEDEMFETQTKTVAIPKDAAYEISFKQFANTSGGIIVQWNAVKDPDLKSYTLYRSVAGKNKWVIVKENFTETRVTDDDLETLKSGTSYDYKLIAEKTNGNAYEAVRENWPYLGVTTMNAPTCTRAGIRVTWPKVEGATKYVVMRSIGAGAPDWKYLTTVSATDDALQVLNTKAGESGSWYAYTVRAVFVDEDGNETYGGQPGGRSILYRAPVKVVKAVSVSKGVRVTFRTVKAGYTYRLYRSEKVNGTWTAYEKVTDLVKVYNGVDEDVWIYDETALSGHTYKYYVRCISKDGAVPLSSYENEYQITYTKP